MSELEPGHPDELCTLLSNWLVQANEPTGTLPVGVTPIEWAVRNFIASWRGPIRAGIDGVEESIGNALAAIEASDLETAKSELDDARQTLANSVRNELGLHDWNRDDT